MRGYFIVAFLILIAASPLIAQTAERGRTPVVAYGVTGPMVTATESQNQLRFTALALAQKIRLKVLSQAGEPVFDSGFQPGNRFEWSVKDQQGSELRDGVYGCLVTLADLNGQMSHRWATFRVKEGAAAFDGANKETSAGANDEVENLTVLRAEEPSPFTLISHDGKEGWIESASGGLSFSAGSLSSTRDAVPHLRLTPEGNLGIGVAEPQAKLDVEGVIRASEGFQFSDGTILKLQDGYPVLVTDSSKGAGVISKSSGGKAGSMTIRVLAAGGSTGPVLASGGPGRPVFNFEGGDPLDNTFYGLTAGASTTGGFNAFFGYGAGFANTTGASNSFFGKGAGTANTTGTYNSFLGQDAGSLSTSGNGNTFVGYQAGYNAAGGSSTTESNNTFVGASTLGAAGITNATAVGYQARVTQSNSLVLGSINGVNGATADTYVGIGTTAPTSKLTVAGDIESSTGFILRGRNMLKYDAFGDLAVGPFSDLSSATDNTFVGWLAGNASAGLGNSIFGCGAGSNSTGADNSFFGRATGILHTTGSYNTFLGAEAGLSSTEESFNTLIGNRSDSFAGITNATAIGSRAKVTQSNSLVLGSINGVNGATADTNVGMGTTSPNYRLHIYHTGTYPRIYIQGDTGKYPGFQLGFDSIGSRVAVVRAVEQDTNGTALQFYTRTDASAMVQGMVINDAGNVGIGTSTPTERLQITGNLKVSGSILYGAPEMDLPDYVFESDYNLMPIQELERFVAREKHLPNVPKASEIREKGLNLSEFQMKLLEKIEELTLYTAQQAKALDRKDTEISALKSKNAVLDARLAAVEQILEQISVQEGRKTSK